MAYQVDHFKHERIAVYRGLSTDTKPTETTFTALRVGDELIETNTGDKYEYLGSTVGWVNVVSNGANLVAEVGIPNQKHDRRIETITATWPGDDTFAVTFTEIENVRRYRWRWNQASGTVNYVKVVEDAINEAQAEAWLADVAESVATDIEYRKHQDADTWSEWIELSKDPNDTPLRRLDFLASGTTPDADIDVEAE